MSVQTGSCVIFTNYTAQGTITLGEKWEMLRCCLISFIFICKIYQIIKRIFSWLWCCC